MTQRLAAEAVTHPRQAPDDPLATVRSWPSTARYGNVDAGVRQSSTCGPVRSPPKGRRWLVRPPGRERARSHDLSLPVGRWTARSGPQEKGPCPRAGMVDRRQADPSRTGTIEQATMGVDAEGPLRHYRGL